MKVVFQPPMTLFPIRFAWMFVVPLIDTLNDATVDQYWRKLVGSYRSERVESNVNTAHTFAFNLVRKLLFILNIHNETEPLGRNHHLLKLPDALDGEAVICRRNNSSFQRLLLDGFVIENYLCKPFFVVWWSGLIRKLGRVFFVCRQRLAEVAPITQYLANGLLCCLRIVKVLE